MNIIIKHNTNQPLYEVVYEQVASQIITRKLLADFCLPPIRTVATELSLSVITIKRAWEMLESNGLIYTITGRGCYVANLSDTQINDKRRELAKRELQTSVEWLRSLGMTPDNIISIIKDIY